MFSARAKLGEPSAVEVDRLARKNGFEIKLDGYRKTFSDRASWPLTARAYTSFRVDGVGRSGSSLWSYPARVLEVSPRAGGSRPGPPDPRGKPPSGYKDQSEPKSPDVEIKRS